MSCVPSGSVSYAPPSAKEMEAQRILNGDYPANTVLLNVYDIVGANSVLHTMGIGVHHTGVEVYGQEFAFGRCKDGTGVFSVTPKMCPGHVFRESVVMGTTSKSYEDIRDLISNLQDSEEWMGKAYHILRRNCNVFSESFVTAVVSSPTDLAGIYSPSKSRDSAATDSAVYTRSPNKENIESLGKQPQRQQLRSQSDNFDSIGQRDTLTLSANNSPTSGGDDSTMGNTRRASAPAAFMPRLEPLTPNWTNRLARIADTLLPDMLINKIEKSDRKAQGMD